MNELLKFHPALKFNMPPRACKPRCQDEFLEAQYTIGALGGTI